MSGINGIGGAMSVDRVMALRAQILERNTALARAGAAGPTAADRAGRLERSLMFGPAPDRESLGEELLAIARKARSSG